MVSDADTDRPVSRSHDGDDGGKDVDKNTPPTSCANDSSTEPVKVAKNPNVFKRIWTILGLDPPTIIIMFKGALPPTIALAAYQGKSFAAKYSTLGYLVAIMSLLGMAIMPRAKFVQNTIMNILFACIGAAIALLQCQVAVKARQGAVEHGTAVGSSGSKQSQTYNAAASTCAGLGLFVTLYIISYLRAKRPQLQFPCIIYSIFTVVASVYAPQFPNMTAAESFVKRLLEAFLTGFGIAVGVSFLVFPMTSRTIAFKQIGGFLKLLQVSLKSHTAYLISISNDHNSAKQEKSAAATNRQKESSSHHHHLFHQKNKAAQQQKESKLSAEAKAMKVALFQIGALFGKTHLEIGFAKKEIAYGKLCPEDFDEILSHSREIFLPIVGVTTFIDIMQSIKDRESTEDMVDSEGSINAIRRLQTEEWSEVFEMSHESFKAFHAAMQGGLSHIAYTLELENRPKEVAADVEKGAVVEPGMPGYSDHLQQELEKFVKHRQGILEEWCRRKDIALPQTFFDDADKKYSISELGESAQASLRKRENQQQLYLILYLRFLSWSTGAAILRMARFADSKVEDGTMKKKRLIVPGWRRLRKLFQEAFASTSDSDYEIDADITGTNVYVGDSLRARKDPEHLPPTTTYQRATNTIRMIPKIFASPESSFGFRVSVATISIAILAYLHSTQVFFLEQRLMWSLILLSISMSPQAGQSIYNFLLRVGGTSVAMVMSYVVWYICDQKVGAIIPILYIYIACCFYFFVKFPKFIVVAILSMVTSILIIGYELQVGVIGVKLATSNGQPYYPLYELAPYRLATVAGGLLVAFIWTYFPYPVTTHSTLRKDLGGTLHLLGNFYSCVHSTLEMRLNTGIGSNWNQKKDKKSPTYRLDKARHKVFQKMIIMLNKLREHSEFTKFEPTFGGKFPKHTYDELIQAMQNVFNYMALISYSSMTFTSDSPGEESAWLKDFRSFTKDLNLTSHEMTSTLCLVSASVTNSQPLPPYLKLPKPYELGRRMEAIDPELLSPSHIREQTYAAFAVLEIASTLVSEEMGRIVKLVQQLVGEMDFSFHIISTSSDTSSTTSTLALSGDSESTKGKKA